MDGDVKPGGPLGAFSRRAGYEPAPVSPSPFLSSSSSSSSHTTQLHYTNSYTYSHPNLNFLQYTIQILVPHVIWSAQAVRELKIDDTQRHLSALRGTRSTQVQWVGIGTHTYTRCEPVPHAARGRRPRWIICFSGPFLGNQKWRNRRERGLDYMEGDWEPSTWISAWPTTVLILSAALC